MSSDAAGVAAVAAAVREGGARWDAAARVALARIGALDPGADGLHAFLSVLDEGGLEVAAAEAERAAPAGALAGVPVAVKDNLATLGFPTTCGSKILEGYRSPYEATVVRRLRAAGALIVGKTNLDEFGMGSSTENSAYGPTRNPYDRTRVPGGSSGGSAAAIAAGIVPAALGSDTGGSVRQPAALCGVVGFKPTYGRVSRYGLVAYASSLDQVGVLGRTVDDAARLLQAIAGKDERDSTSADRPVPDLAAAVRAGREDADGGALRHGRADGEGGARGGHTNGGARAAARPGAGLVVGVPREYFPADLDAAVRGPCEVALERLRAAGAEVRSVSLPSTAHAIPAYYLIAPAEASANLARYDGIRFGPRPDGARSLGELYERTRSAGFGTEVKRRILIGTYALSAGYQDQYYGRAQKVRALVMRDFERVFADGVDMLFTPTSPTPSFRIGERIDDPYQMYLSDVFTVTANLAGLPALSLPIGRAGALPVGGQLLGPRWAEGSLVRTAAALEVLLADAWEPGVTAPEEVAR